MKHFFSLYELFYYSSCDSLTYKFVQFFTSKHFTETIEVQFLEDHLKYECSLWRIKNRTVLRPGDIRMVKWEDGHYYKAKIEGKSKFIIFV